MASRLLSHERLRPFATLLTAGWIVYWIVLCGLTHWPKLPRMPIQISKEGLVMHFTAYSVLTIGCLLSRLARVGHFSAAWSAKWIGIFAAYAILEELTQSFTGRHPSILDFCADMVGVLVVMFIARPWYRPDELSAPLKD